MSNKQVFKELKVNDKVKVICTEEECSEICLDKNYNNYIGEVTKVYKDRAVVCLVNETVMFPIHMLHKKEYIDTCDFYEDWIDSPEYDKLAEAYIRDANK